MKKLFTLLTMLVICISGMWAADVTPVTALENGKYYLKMISSGSERIVYYDSSSSYLIWKNYINLNSDCQVFIFTQGTGTYAGRYTIQTSDGKYVTYTSVSESNGVKISSGSDATDSNKWWVLGVDGTSYDIYPWREGSISTDQPAWNMAVKIGNAANAAVGLYNGTNGNSKVTLKKMQKHILASPEPSNGSFAANTIWYTIKNNTAGNYLHDNGDETKITLNRTNTWYSAKDLFCFVGDLEHGYKIYNMAAGVNKILSSSKTMGSAFYTGTYDGPWPVMTQLTNGNVPDGYNTTWDLSLGNTISGENGFLFTQHGTTDHTLNARGGLGYWNGADDGSTMRLAEVTFANLVESANNLHEGEQADYVGFHTNDANNTLRDAITAARAVVTPSETDFETLVEAMETFTSSSTVTLEQGKYYRFVSASTAKPGYVVSANSDNKLIWEAEDNLDEKQFWKVTWLNENKIEATFMNVGTNMYPQEKTGDSEQFELGTTATNTNIVALGSGQYNIKPNNQKSMHVAGWKTSDTTGNIVSWNNTVIGDPSAWYISEIEKYNIEITGNVENGRLIINGNEYANGSKFYCPKNTEFTPVAKTITGYISGEIVFSGNTISVEYTGYNGIINGMTTISADAWTTKENWDYLTDNWNNYGPGCSVSGSTKGMWSPIYLKDIKGGTVPALDGWNFRMIADHSTYEIAEVGKIQGGKSCYFTLKNTSVVTMNFGRGHTFGFTVNLDEGTGNILNFNMSNGYNHACQTDCNGKITVNYGSVSKNTGRVFNASGSGAINNLVLNATLTEPTEKNKVEEIPLVTYTSGVSATVTCNISGTGGWTKATSLKDLKAQTSDGKYYYVEESSSTGVILYTYKLNAPVEVNSGAITVAAEITSGVVSLINTAIVNNKATSVDLTAATTKEITGLEIPANCLNCLVIVNNGTTVKDGSNENIENNVVVKNGENYSCEKLVLTDKVPFKAPVGFTAASITHERKTSSTSAVWGTACLPYPVKSVSGDDGIRYYQLSESNSKEGVMSFTLITDEIAANTPVVFIKSSGAEFNFNSTGKRVAITPANPESSEIQGKTLVGTFAGSNDVATDDSKNYYYISGNKFWHATGTLKVSPFRAYFTETKDGQSVRNYTLQVVDDGNVTRIDSVEGFDMSDEQVYTLDGKKVNNVKKGSIYIIGGNKVVIK